MAACKHLEGSPPAVPRLLQSDVEGPKVDYISALPDCVLSCILSMISMKDMMKTSILSKRWCNLWHLRRNLKFDAHNMLGNGRIMSSHDERNEFVKRVNQFLKNYKGTKIDSFMVDFELNYEPSSTIDEWIRFAIARGVGRIELLTPSYYKFPFGLSFEGKDPTLKHMHLRRCIICDPGTWFGRFWRMETKENCHPATNIDLFTFTNLRSLKIEGSTVDVNLLTTLLSNCLLLEELSLISSSINSSSLKIESSSLCHLKIEELFCSKKKIEEDLDDHHYHRHLKFISLDCPKLTYFYFDNTISGSLSMNAPILKTIEYIVSSHAEKIHDAFALFAKLPKLETLNLYINKNTFEVTPLQGIQTLENLRQFNLSIDATYEDFDIWWILPILQASPFLQKLSVTQRGSLYIETLEAGRLAQQAYLNKP
ncbi:F-box/LRR-repeat protein At3g58900-like [Lotus japonicus]|uniref:F-box/LRR-repeat protein At3g58900-like n=1 Tax=Lotus japonicus TaxID=34305 RepID=UPI0025826ACE|nr:F-box/LRR-repeat protein At3g58900-like [Lotus japonicus]